MFGHQTMLDGVWSPNISRLSRALSLQNMFRMTNIHRQLRIQNYHDPVLFTNFLVQAVAPVMSARQTDILLHVFVNI